MSKDKKKTKKDKKKAASNGSLASLKAMTENPLVADVVAAALVATAAALKDSKKARRLAGEAGEQLTDIGKEAPIAETRCGIWRSMSAAVPSKHSRARRREKAARESEAAAQRGLTNFSAYWSVWPRIASSKIGFV